MPRLTLATIVRDEEDFLPGCLASVRDVVDAMVVVDTGSTDGTEAAARAAGATVVRHRWGDDFAAARNAALEHIPGGYVLVLDADERLARTGVSALREAVRRDELDCGVLPLFNASSLEDSEEEVLEHGAALSAPILLGRLLRRTPDLRWEGTIHEHLTTWARAHPRRALVEAPIVHYGEVPSVREQRQKGARNRRLLEERVRRDPDDPHAAAYLCQELLRAGERSRAHELARRAWSAVDAPGSRPGPSGVLPASLLGQLCIERREYDEAERVLLRARELCEDHPNLRYLLGCTYEQRWLAGGGRTPALLKRAEEHFRAAVSFGARAFATPALAGVTGWSGWTRLGTVLLLQERFEEALAEFDRAMLAGPDPTEAQLGALEARLSLGQLSGDDLAQAVQEMCADACVLAAVAARASGDASRVAQWTRQAVSRAKQEGIRAPHRLLTLRALALEASRRA